MIGAPKIPNFKGLKVTTVPVNKPVTTTEMKLWLQLDSGFTDDDTLIADLIDAAVESCQVYTQRSLITQTLTYRLDRFPTHMNQEPWWDGVRQGAITELYGSYDFLPLTRGPLQSVTSLSTFDDSNAETTFSSDNYFADTQNDRIVLNDGQIWPVDLRDWDAVKVVYVAGYGDDASDVPAPIRTGIKMHVAKMYETRTACELPEDCKRLYNNERNVDRWYANG